jgi:hypothetical protein
MRADRLDRGRRREASEVSRCVQDAALSNVTNTADNAKHRIAAVLAPILA